MLLLEKPIVEENASRVILILSEHKCWRCNLGGQLKMLRWCHMSRVFITATQKDKGAREQARGPSSHNFPYTPLFPLSTFIPSFWEMRYNILLIRLPACLAVTACPKRKNREGNSKPQVTEFLTSHHSTNIKILATNLLDNF